MTATEIRPSVGQTLLWFLDRYRGEEGALNCPVLCRLRGPLDHDRLREAIAQVLSRHEALRSTFTGGGRRLKALVHPAVSPPVREVDLSGEPDPETCADREVAAELGTRIDATECAVRITLWRLAEDHHVLCLNMHHMVTDSWSCNVIFEDLCAALEGKPCGDALAYSRFAEEQREALAGPSGKRLRAFWSERLKDLTLPPLPMRPATAGAPRDTRLVQHVLDAPTVAALGALAKRERSTMFVALLTAYYRALKSLSGAEDLAVATLFANRGAEHRRTVGFLANMVLLRTRLADGDFAAQLRATHGTVMEAFVHQALPFQMLPISPGDTERRLDDVVFQMMADPVYSTRAGGLDIEVLVPDDVATRFELELVAVPDRDTVRVLLFYNPDRFTPEFAESLLAAYVDICTTAARGAEPHTDHAGARPRQRMGGHDDQ
ncbi:condensation domain-containing protein (plasmid) [Streptomyces sp. NBC_00727]|uniref:condensation domain-containing protein n=1 Tax=Streptomyces sp. NBC_00727 TaxID=2903675 RepID=UPI002F90C654